MSIERILKENSIKITKGRIAILKVLGESQEPLCAEDIYNITKKMNININLSTVYRGLELFDEKGLVDKFILNQGVYMYKLKGEEHKHLLECDICHKEVEVPCPMKQVEALVELNTGFKLTEHNLVLKGICNNCKKRE